MRIGFLTYINGPQGMKVALQWSLFAVAPSELERNDGLINEAPEVNYLDEDGLIAVMRYKLSVERRAGQR
jgi:hypothetical protein